MSDDEELDAELLALAGGESSSDEEDEVKPSPKRKSDNRDHDQSEDRSPPRRGAGTKLKSRATARRNRNADESDEEGEASDDSNSLGSAAMDESESENVGADFDEDKPLYPIEGKFSSERDRADIMAMTEIQREEILAERAAEVQRRAQDQQLKRLLSARNKSESDKKKRKANAADLDDSQRKSSRQRTKANDPLEAYKRQRELKGAQRARGEERRREREQSEEAGYSDEDADGEDEVQWDDGHRASPTKEDPPAELRDFERVRVGRSNFTKVCLYPTFETLIKSCYCRVSVGMEGGQAYRMLQIKGFKEGRPYTMDGPNNKKIYTDQYVVCGQGKKEKEYPFQACSDSKFTEGEFAEFRNALSADGVRFPTRTQIGRKLDDIHALLDHQWTDEDIQNRLNKDKAMRAKHMNFGRDRIIRRRDEAASRGDDTVVARCNQELAAYDAGGPKPDLKVGVAPNNRHAQQERLAQLNRQNRKLNSEEVRKAQIATKRAEQKAREEGIARQRKLEEEKVAAAAAKSSSLAVPDDLFGDASDISRAGTPGVSGNGTPKKGPSRAGTPANGGAAEKKKFGQFRKKNLDDDVIAGMDLGIEIDI